MADLNDILLDLETILIFVAVVIPAGFYLVLRKLYRLESELKGEKKPKQKADRDQQKTREEIQPPNTVEPNRPLPVFRFYLRRRMQRLAELPIIKRI